MDRSASGVSFAVIGHQDHWENIGKFVNGLRSGDQEKLSVEKIKDIFPFIPPRTLFKVKVKSITGSEIDGIYIETFIDPDKLEIQHAKTNVRKVMQAAAYAEKAGAAITTLGGFTSIVQEGNLDTFPKTGIKFTTGNTLTAAYIVKGVEAAAEKCGIDLGSSKLLILGATGDLGLACIDYFKNKVSQMLLCARNQHRLEKLAKRLTDEDLHVKYHVSIDELLPEADIVICVASAVGLNFSGYKKNILVCDAGYPKNVDQQINYSDEVWLFHGGMGQISMGYQFDPDYSDTIYHYPAPGIGHGCVLEAIVLAFENKFESYSSGKGNITTEKMEEIYGWGLKHGITLAPFHNANGLWPL